MNRLLSLQSLMIGSKCSVVSIKWESAIVHVLWSPNSRQPSSHSPNWKVRQNSKKHIWKEWLVRIQSSFIIRVLSREVLVFLSPIFSSCVFPDRFCSSNRGASKLHQSIKLKASCHDCVENFLAQAAGMSHFDSCYMFMTGLSFHPTMFSWHCLLPLGT